MIDRRGSSAPLDPIEQLSPTEARERHQSGSLLLDVRTPAEWAAGHAPDTTWIPLDELEQRFGELDPNVSVVAICRVGGRSQAAADFLSSRGLHVANLAGGMMAWEADGLDVIDDEGAPGAIL